MSKLLTSEEVLEELEKFGYSISLRTLRYYVDKGLVNRVITRSGSKKGKKGSAGYYTEDVVQEIIFIKQLQERGFKLKEISEIKQNQVKGSAVMKNGYVEFIIRVPLKSLVYKDDLSCEVKIEGTKEERSFLVNFEKEDNTKDFS